MHNAYVSGYPVRWCENIVSEMSHTMSSWTFNLTEPSTYGDC